MTVFAAGTGYVGTGVTPVSDETDHAAVRAMCEAVQPQPSDCVLDAGESATEGRAVRFGDQGKAFRLALWQTELPGSIPERIGHLDRLEALSISGDANWHSRVHRAPGQP